MTIDDGRTDGNVRCRLCVWTGVRLLDHVRTNHPEHDDYDRWPDGDIVVVDLTDPEWGWVDDEWW
jgi:hypothetical protein